MSGQTWVNPELGPLHRSFEPQDLLDASNGVCMDSFVVVEAGESQEENQVLAEMSDSCSTIGAFIAWTDLEKPNLVKDIESWHEYPKFRGVRMRFEGHDDPEVLRRPKIRDGLSVVIDNGYIFDFLVRTHHLDDLLKICDEKPDLKGIIEHMAKPDMVHRSDQTKWMESMTALARNTGLKCKISLSPRWEEMPQFLEGASAKWSPKDIKPFVHHLLDEFGYERLIWGSDWPISSVTKDYPSTYLTMKDAIGQIRPDEEARMFRENAAHFYGLKLL